MKFSRSQKVYIHILFAAFAILASCTSDVEADEFAEEVEDSKAATELMIESTTIENINDQLLAVDISAFDSDEMLVLRGIRDDKACINAQFKGDVNNNDLLSVEDVIILLEAIKEYDDIKKYPESANGDGQLNIVNEYKGESPDFWTMVHIAKLVNANESGKSHSILQRADVAVLMDVLIGECQ